MKPQDIIREIDAIKRERPSPQAIGRVLALHARLVRAAVSDPEARKALDAHPELASLDGEPAPRIVRASVTIGKPLTVGRTTEDDFGEEEGDDPPGLPRDDEDP